MGGRMRIGEILVERGVLTPGQVNEILDLQAREALPFGVLAERIFAIDKETIQDAWLHQYRQFASVVSGGTDTDPDTLSPQVQATLHRLAGIAA